MKVLVVLSQPPAVEAGAPGRCAIGLLRGLRAHGVGVHAIAARQHFALSGEPPPDLDVEIVPVQPERGRAAIAMRRLRRPRGELARGPFLAAVRAAARDADVIHLEETETSWCDLGTATPSLAHLHYLVRRDRAVPAPWRSEFRDLVEFSLGERAAIRRHRFLVASSPLIAAELRRRRPEADVVLAPLALDPSDYEPAALDGPPAAGLIGTAAWPPTAAAMRRLVERVWPRVLEHAPDAQLRVAGRGVDRLGLAPTAGVEVAGEVPSGRDFIRALSVLAFPLDRGSGMKVKVLESIALGVPVVTTPAGAEGIDADDGVTVAADDAELAGAIAELLLDARRRRAAGDAARSAFERRYAPAPATATLPALYERMTT